MKVAQGERHSQTFAVGPESQRQYFRSSAWLAPVAGGRSTETCGEVLVGGIEGAALAAVAAQGDETRLAGVGVVPA